ncbi:hypothetical protein [Actinokineospora inagensis]|uniref:hypothetical protein n=1 Tax=Actinokineospora inagensis TaxID=103730 RepID=UPI001FDF8FFF|nr:hypothetical protein [Actinokineospora inagensis]
MWQWLRATCVPLYDTYWTVRGWEEFEVMFGRKPFATFADAGEDSPASDYRSLLAAEFDQTIIHFGEGRRNPATIACMIAELEQKLATRLGITLPDPPATRARTGPWGI